MAIIGEFEPAALVDLEGEIIEGVLARKDILVQQDAGAEEVRPLEF